MKFIERPSPNFNERKDGKTPRFLILHYTDTRSAEDAMTLLCSPEKQVSAHYVIDTNGDAYKLVDEEKRAWHAGKSYWLGETDINSASIGIEIQNPGHQFGYTPFPQAQMDAVAEISRGIIKRHNILPHDILAHSDIAPARKIDPGELFPWQWLAQQGVGVWPDNSAADNQNIAGLLHEYGYDPSVDLPTLISAFQRRFEQDVFLKPGAAGIATPRTVGRIRRLLALSSARTAG